jgi:glycosyltransferase involved in cell wall biosynthesis
MRIAHVVNEPFLPMGANGVQQVIYCLARAQADAGHSVKVFSRDDGTAHVLRDDALARARTGSRHGVAEPSLRDRVLARWLEVNIATDLLSWGAEIVHFHSVHILENVALAAWLTRVGIPYVITPHGGLFSEAQQRGRLRKALFDAAIERHYLQHGALIHAVGESEAAAIRERLPGQSVVLVPNGLPPDAGTPPSRPDLLTTRYPELRGRRVFMFVGRLDPWQKGLDLLIEAFGRVSTSSTALVLVGPDDRAPRRSLSRLAGRLGGSARIVFAGPAFGEDRANLLAGARVFVHPSRWEGCSLSVLVAIATGKPCLLTRAADPLGQLESAHAAIVVEPTVASVASGLERAAALTEDELSEMGERARGVAHAQLSWGSVAAKLTDAYQSVRVGAEHSQRA